MRRVTACLKCYAVFGRPGRKWLALLCAAAVLLPREPARGANTVSIFSTSASDMSAGTNYSPTITPTSATTTDVEFSASTYTGTPFNANGDEEDKAFPPPTNPRSEK